MKCEARRAVEQEVKPHHRGFAYGIVVGRHRDDLDADMAACRRAGRNGENKGFRYLR
jgi:hypothetical protein